MRIGPVRFIYSGSSHLAWSHFPEDRLSTWKTLIEHWPKSPTRQLSLAFDLYLDSIRERQQVMRGGAPFDKAMLSAAVAMEVLTGYRASNEITRTVAQRAAHLVADGEDAWNVYRAVKKLYGIRSKIVHEGTADAGVATTIAQQYLMSAIPAAAAAHPMVNHGALMTALDEANFRKPQLVTTIREATWARYVPIADICADYVSGRSS